MNNEKLNPSIPSPAALASQVNPDYAIQRVENSPLHKLTESKEIVYEAELVEC